MIILASKSPRRKQLLEKLGVEFKIIESDFDESSIPVTSPETYTQTLAFSKAKSVFDKTGGIVIGADTVVYFNGKIIGKPKNKQDAINTLLSLSGKSHEVITGYAVISNKKTVLGYEKSTVLFNDLSLEFINSYVETGLPLDKAGSYGVQDGFEIVNKITGSYDNVVGLPTEKISQILAELK